MRIRLIARVALSALLLTVMLVVKADDSETGGPWKQNLKMGTKQIQTGSTTTWEVVPGTAMPVIVTTPIYTTISCCIQATDSDACNSGSADSRC
jgi:hypothetical protein